MTTLELAKALKCGIFAERDTIEEAFQYVSEVAMASENPGAVLAAVHVTINTIANKIIEKEEAK